MLRAARDAKSMALEEIAAETRIRLVYLRFLEGDKFDELPGSVYAIGFIRNYCKVVGIDPREAIDTYYLQTDVPGASYLPGTRIAPGPGRPASVRSVLTVLVAVVILVIAANFLWRTYRPSAAPSPATPAPPTAVATVETVLPPFSGGATSSRVPAGWMSFTVTAQMNVNVQVIGDGLPLFAGFMSPGQRRTWAARDAISLIADNAGGLSVEINGQLLGQLGPVGQRLQQEWRASDFK